MCMGVTVCVNVRMRICLCVINTQQNGVRVSEICREGPTCVSRSGDLLGCHGSVA